MRKLLVVLAIIFTILSIVFSALPLDTIAFLPIGLGVLFCLLLLKKSPANQKKLPTILLLLCVLSSVFVLGKTLLVKDEVVKDVKFEKEKYVFKGNTVNSTSKKKNSPETQNTFTIGGSTQDVISLLYKVRTMDLSKFKVGQTQSLMIVFDEKQIPVTLKYMGKETISAGNLGSKECYKLSIGAKTDALKGKDKNLIWLTADPKKVPALLKFSIPVGTGQLTLTSATGI